MPLDDLGDHAVQGLGRERLGEEVDRPEPHRGHGVGDASVSRDDDHRDVVALVAEPPEHFHALDTGHLKVEEHDVDRVLRKSE